MPSGFIGHAAKSYLTHSTNAISRAASTNTSNRSIRGGESPVTPEEANRGGFKTGTGNSSNVVVDSVAYDNAMRRLNRMDDQIGETFYRICEELEDICQTSFILPRTNRRFMFLCGRVKNAMNRYRQLTDNMVIRTQRFVQRITNVGTR